MRSLAALSALAIALVVSVNATTLPRRAISLHAEAHHLDHQLEKRLFTPNQLWNISGPVARDVRQKIVLDCWWKAAEAVIAHVSSTWIENLFIDPSTKQTYLKQGVEQPQADFPMVQLWDPHTLQAHWFETTIHNRSQSEDKGMEGFFWPDALTQGLSQLGRQTDVNGVNRTTGITGPTNNYYQQPLSILTGYPAASRDFNDYDNSDGADNDLWSHFRYCNSTPIMFNTMDIEAVETEDQFGDHHVYPVIDAYWEESGQRWVKVGNVWGKTESYKFEDVRKNGNSTLFLRDWNKLEWQESWQ